MRRSTNFAAELDRRPPEPQASQISFLTCASGWYCPAYPETSRGQRTGSLMIEATVALAIIAIVAAIVAQSIVWSLEERSRAASHQAANELAANVLEAARALPFDKLDQQWADAQGLPSEMAVLLPGGKVLVTVEALKTSANTRRVAVEVRWTLAPNQPPQSVQLTTVLSGREAKSQGGTP